ncbi:helix-turn-helix domain-containing protein [Alicyclobacillus macrosporangiidus]|nr:helix-turn-helix transcriptional regulator [Alicyclobacillus macrosporangiidus]
MKVKRGMKAVVARALRGAANLTQDEEAAAVNVHRTVISRVENGAPMSDDLFDAIIGACGGAPFIDWLIDLLQAAKEWHQTRRRIGPLLYA